MDFCTLQGLLSLIPIGVAAFMGAYLAEKAKNLARKEDLDKIRTEVQAVTLVQKSIEAKISGEMWNRQYMFQARRELYADLLVEFRDLENVNLKLLAEVPFSPDRRDLVLRAGDESNAHLKTLWRLAGLSRVLLSASATAALDGFLERGDDDGSVKRIQETLEAIKATEDRLVEVARADLGWGEEVARP